MLADVFFYFGEKDESKITKVKVQIPIIHSFAESDNTLPGLEKVSLICALHNLTDNSHILSLICIINTSSIIKSRQTKKKK